MPADIKIDSSLILRAWIKAVCLLALKNLHTCLNSIVFCFFFQKMQSWYNVSTHTLTLVAVAPRGYLTLLMFVFFSPWGWNFFFCWSFLFFFQAGSYAFFFPVFLFWLEWDNTWSAPPFASNFKTGSVSDVATEPEMVCPVLTVCNYYKMF